MEILKVSAKTEVKSLAGAAAGFVREEGRAEMQAIGAGAVNVAMKAAIVARGFLAPAGFDLVCTPSFMTIVIDGEERTALRLMLTDRCDGCR